MSSECEDDGSSLTQIYSTLYQYRLDLLEYHREAMDATVAQIRERLSMSEQDEDPAIQADHLHRRESTGGSTEESFTAGTTRNTSVDGGTPIEISLREVDPDSSDDDCEQRNKGKEKEGEIQEVQVSDHDGQPGSPQYVLGPSSFEQALRNDAEQQRGLLDVPSHSVAGTDLSPISEETSHSRTERLSSPRVRPSDPQALSAAMEEEAWRKSIEMKHSTMKLTLPSPKGSSHTFDENQSITEEEQESESLSDVEEYYKALGLNTEAPYANIPLTLNQRSGPEAFATRFIDDGPGRQVSVRDILLHMDQNNNVIDPRDLNEGVPFCIIDRLAPPTNPGFKGATVYWTRSFRFEHGLKYTEVGVTWYIDRSTKKEEATRYALLVHEKV
ncbi:hypothetical protein PVAG01_06001 [Phlyctema vagabunda]|uniref:Uncharacterized protein n=1 Tax=Phlyctema vagabunda TaxID=108571 RepID=A0ABR4PEU7_9HELO